MSKRVFITGDQGFIGLVLADAMRNDGWTVHGYDIQNGEDILDSLRLEREMAQFSPDVVVHLAAIPGAEYCERYPERAVETNVVGTWNVATAALRARARGFIHFSSSSVLGGTTQSEGLREGDPIRPVGVYGRTKYLSEVAVRTIWGERTGDVIVRPFSVYGDHGRHDSVIWKWIDAIKRKESISVIGSGYSSRGYTHVEDVALAVKRIATDLLSPASCLRAPVSTLHIGGAERICTEYLVGIFREVLGPVFSVSNVDKPEWHIEHSFADTRFAEKFIGFAPEKRFEKTVKAILQREFDL